MRDSQKAPIADTNSGEGAVVASEAKGTADGWIDEPSRAARDINGERNGVEESPRDVDGFAGSPVESRELGVLSEAARQQIDLPKLTNELAASKWEHRGIGDAENGAGAERAQPYGRDHEPPETTTGGVCVADGAGAGVGAGAGADGGAALSFPGPGGAGSGGMAVLVAADATCLRGFGDCCRRADAPDTLCPGAEAAAIPANSPLRIADTARTPLVSLRMRAASLSRATIRCLSVWASLIWEVEQHSMNDT